MRTILKTALSISVLLAAPVCAAENSAQLPHWAPLAALLALGVGFVVLAIFLYLCFHALFLHLATQIAGLHQPFSTALRAWVVSIVFQILGGIALAFFAPFVRISLPLLILLATTLAIMVVYETGLLRALASAALAMILTIAGTIALVMLLAALTVGLHRHDPHQHQSTPPPQRDGKICM